MRISAGVTGRQAAVLVLTGVLVGAGGGAAFAGVANGSSISTSGKGGSYTAYASIDNSNRVGRTYMQTTNGRVDPAGYFGVSASTFKGSAGCGSTPVYWTESARASTSNTASVGNCAPGNIQASGYAYTYQSNGTTFAKQITNSPALTFS